MIVIDRRLMIAVAVTGVVSGSAGAQGAAPTAAPAMLSVAEQLVSAVMPLPPTMRAGARVMGYDASKKLVELRAATAGNGMTCLADEPGDERFHVACYAATMEPFMGRGRELRAQGVKGDAVDSARFREVKDGKLKMPAQPAALYSLTGKAAGWNGATGQLTGASRLYVVYIPGATEQSTGLSTVPQKDGPWLMFPGTPKAHIMFTPDMR